MGTKEEKITGKQLGINFNLEAPVLVLQRASNGPKTALCVGERKKGRFASSQTCAQFHQYFTSSFCCATCLLPKKLQSQTVIRDWLHKKLL